MRHRRSRLLGFVLCAGMAVVAVAKPVPDLRFKDLSGQTQSLGKLQGSIAVINFWATWCAPCREEMPRLSRLQQQYAARGVRFVAISADAPKDQGKIGPMLEQQKISLDVWTGADLDTLDKLHLGNVLPATLVIDARGEVIGRILGEAREQDVTGYLDWLLDGRQGAAPAGVLKRY